MFRSIFGKESSAAARQRQVKTLRIYNKDVCEKGADQYQVLFDSGGTQYTLSVYLPAGYPEDRPLLTVSPAIQHPWLDSNMMITGAPGIVNYTKHCDLGQLVQNIIHELVKFLAGGSPAQCISGHVHLTPAVFPAVSPNVPVLEPELCPELSTISSEELQHLLDDDDCLNELVDRLPTSLSLYQQLESAMNTCQQLANETLSMESRVGELRDSVSCLHETLVSEVSEFDQLEAQYDQLAGRHSPALLLQLLQISAAECDQLSDKCVQQMMDSSVQQMMDSSVPAESFIKSYMQQRSLYYIRRTKQEKLSVMLGDV